MRIPNHANLRIPQCALIRVRTYVRAVRVERSECHHRRVWGRPTLTGTRSPLNLVVEARGVAMITVVVVGVVAVAIPVRYKYGGYGFPGCAWARAR